MCVKVVPASLPSQERALAVAEALGGTDELMVLVELTIKLLGAAELELPKREETSDVVAVDESAVQLFVENNSNAEAPRSSFLEAIVNECKDRK